MQIHTINWLLFHYSIEFGAWVSKKQFKCTSQEFWNSVRDWGDVCNQFMLCWQARAVWLNFMKRGWNINNTDQAQIIKTKQECSLQCSAYQIDDCYSKDCFVIISWYHSCNLSVTNKQRKWIPSHTQEMQIDKNKIVNSSEYLRNFLYPLFKFTIWHHLLCKFCFSSY